MRSSPGRHCHRAQYGQCRSHDLGRRGVIVPRERFYVEVGPELVRLRHQLGLRTKFGRDRLGPLMEQVVRQPEDLEDAGEPIELSRLDPNQEAEILVAEEEACRENEELFLDTLDPDEVAHYFQAKELEAARQAVRERLGRGGQGNVGAKPAGDVAAGAVPAVRDARGSAAVDHSHLPGRLADMGCRRRDPGASPTAFGEAWFQAFGERPVGFWTKGFQLAEGRPHIHLLTKGPDSMSDLHYRTFQILTRLGNETVRQHGKRQGRWWTPPIGGGYGGQTADELLRMWSNITTDGTVGRYFGTFGYRGGFKPTVELLEAESSRWPSGSDVERS